jgi:hypothetical protein
MIPDFIKESEKYRLLNPPRRRPRQYSHDLAAAVEARIPPSIREAMARVGWNAFGVYEVVEEEIKKEKKAKKGIKSA